MAFSLKKIFLPDSDTKLLAGFERSMETVGAVVSEGSIASARARLTLAESVGKGASVEYPWYFHIGGILYVASGEKNASNGRWVLRPVNEQEAIEQTYTLGTKLTVASGQWSAMITSNLPARPYDRAVQVWGTAYGSVSGAVDLDIRIRDTDDVLARFSAGDQQSVAVTNYGIIPAGTAPGIRLGVRGGGPSGGYVGLSADGRLNRLIVVATPITMA